MGSSSTSARRPMLPEEGHITEACHKSGGPDGSKGLVVDLERLVRPTRRASTRRPARAKLPTPGTALRSTASSGATDSSFRGLSSTMSRGCRSEDGGVAGTCRCALHPPAEAARGPLSSGSSKSQRGFKSASTTHFGGMSSKASRRSWKDRVMLSSNFRAKAAGVPHAHPIAASISVSSARCESKGGDMSSASEEGSMPASCAGRFQVNE
mmetsp:Transcript_5953/g.15191  ORF Transcript_5953/g.15191 Transcript_5953/m.15191 type:complete len:210 (-) Transcript_5953:78-707(-)